LKIRKKCCSSFWPRKALAWAAEAAGLAVDRAVPAAVAADPVEAVAPVGAEVRTPAEAFGMREKHPEAVVEPAVLEAVEVSVVAEEPAVGQAVVVRAAVLVGLVAVAAQVAVALVVAVPAAAVLVSAVETDLEQDRAAQVGAAVSVVAEEPAAGPELVALAAVEAGVLEVEEPVVPEGAVPVEAVADLEAVPARVRADQEELAAREARNPENG
jgi:hypothetical protein